ncbi:transposase [Roseateles sp.]|uniref:transposase n=1 Tax=Roseateles sp. TaxID=1971397 RepID=UPI002E02B422|nr:hypothetical protein [Roseateles sp.]
MNTASIRPFKPFALPLCRSYVAVLFSPILVQLSPVGGAADAHPEPMLWALGILADGLPDFLGAWQFSGPKGPRWGAIVDDLKRRGVVRVRFVIGPDPVDIEAALLAQYGDGNRKPDCTVLPSSGPTVESAFVEGLLPGHRPYIDRAREVAIPLGRRLGRAVARHGGFVDPASAAALLYQSAERYIRANWPEPPEPRPSFASSLPALAVQPGLVAAG